MLFKDIVERKAKLCSGFIVKIDDENEFTLKINDILGSDHKINYKTSVCEIINRKGNFEISKICINPETNSNIELTDDPKSFVFSQAHLRKTVTFFIEMIVEYDETPGNRYFLNVSKEQMDTLERHQFYQNIIMFPKFDNYKFACYVRKNMHGQVEIHIENFYENVKINDKAGDFIETCYDRTDYYKLLIFDFDMDSNTITKKSVTPISSSISKASNASAPLPIFYEIMSDTTYADCIILSSCGKEIPAYRCVLSKYSKVFKKIFDESKEVVKVPEFDTEIIKAALNFCYGKNDAIQGNEAKLFEFAEKYGIQELKNACCEYFEKSLDAANVCEIIQIAYSNNFENLKKKCQSLLIKNKNSINFEELPKNIIIDILKGI